MQVHAIVLEALQEPPPTSSSSREALGAAGTGAVQGAEGDLPNGFTEMLAEHGGGT